jgi:hypothetical protein
MALEMIRIGGDRAACPIVLNVETHMLRADRDPALEWVLDPPFQRGPVWTLRQKRAWIESLMGGLPLPAIFINQFGLRPGSKPHPVYGVRDIVIDGQQRIRAIMGFLQDKFQVRGEYYSQQSQTFKRVFRMDPVCPFIYSKFATMRECAELYVRLLTAGTAHTPAEIGKAQRFLRRCED